MARPPIRQSVRRRRRPRVCEASGTVPTGPAPNSTTEAASFAPLGWLGSSRTGFNLLPSNYARRITARRRSALLGILAVCTGNVCRSPLAEQLLIDRLAGFDVSVTSAGTRARDGASMTPETAGIAVSRGCIPERVASHRAQLLTPEHLRAANLALAMTREHRREIVEMDPSLVRRTFTFRELSRLLGGVSDDQLRDGSRPGVGQSTPEGRLSAMLAFAASRRGVVSPVLPEDDDVVDPYRRSARTYALSAGQISEALPTVQRLVHLASDRWA